MRGITGFFKGRFYFPKYEKTDRVYYILILLALIRPVGFVFHSPEIDGIGAATCISPLPTVFSKPGGIEAFTSTFLIVYSESPGKTDTVSLTPGLFAKIEGPHPFRNAVSLTLGYFPLLVPATARSILHHLFYETNLLRDLGIPECASYTLINRNFREANHQEWVIQINADEK
jgi:hypothetical protein